MLVKTIAVAAALLSVQPAAGGAPFSATLQSLGRRNFELENAHLSPTLRRIVWMAQRQSGADCMAMVFDESGSITAGHFETSKRFAADVINSERQPSVDNLNLEMSVVRFGTRASVVLSPTRSRQMALDSVQRMRYGDARSTNIADGLSTARDQLIYCRGQRLVMLWTDGRHNTNGDPVEVARQMKAAGTCVVVVAIGPDVDQNQLAQIEGCRAQYPPPYPCNGDLCPMPVGPTDWRGVAGGGTVPGQPGMPDGSNSGNGASGGARPPQSCQGGGLLIKTDFDEIEADTTGFMERVQNAFEAGTKCNR